MLNITEYVYSVLQAWRTDSCTGGVPEPGLWGSVDRCAAAAWPYPPAPQGGGERGGRERRGGSAGEAHSLQLCCQPRAWHLAPVVSLVALQLWMHTDH